MQPFRQHIALFLLAVISVFTVPKELWHFHEDSKEVGTLECEHDSHLDAEQDNCYVCQLHTPNFFHNNCQAFASPHKYFVDHIPEFVDPLIVNIAHLPFQRGPPA